MVIRADSAMELARICHSKHKPLICAENKNVNMGYSSGILFFMIQVLNRAAAKGSAVGLDGNGIEWVEGDWLHANITWSKGTKAMNAGALDSYAVRQVRMRWTDKITMRSRIKWEDQIYQILPESFAPDKHADTLQFLMQLVVNE